MADTMDATAAGPSSATDGTGRKLKGRGAGGQSSTTMNDSSSSGYDSVAAKKGFGPAKCVCARLRPLRRDLLRRPARQGSMILGPLAHQSCVLRA